MLFGTDQTITRKAKRRTAVRAFQGEQAAHVLSKANFDKGAEIYGIQPAGSGFGVAGYRQSNKTLDRMGEGRTSGFYNVTPGSALL